MHLRDLILDILYLRLVLENEVTDLLQLQYLLHYTNAPNHLQLLSTIMFLILTGT